MPYTHTQLASNDPHPLEWPQLTRPVGTTTSRSQLYLSPFSYVNALRLDNLLFPEQWFNETYDKLDQIIKRRQQRLTKKQILDKTQYQEGNIILAVNHPITHTKGQSQELAMTVRGVHYVKKVFPDKLRVVGLFSGEERTLPGHIAKRFHWITCLNYPSNSNTYNSNE